MALDGVDAEALTAARERFTCAQAAAKAAAAQLRVAREEAEKLERAALQAAAAAVSDDGGDGLLHTLAQAQVCLYTTEANQAVLEVFARFAPRTVVNDWARKQVGHWTSSRGPDGPTVILPAVRVGEGGAPGAGIGLLALLDHLEGLFGPLGDQVLLDADDDGVEMTLLVTRPTGVGELTEFDQYQQDTVVRASGPLQHVLAWQRYSEDGEADVTAPVPACSGRSTTTQPAHPMSPVRVTRVVSPRHHTGR